MTGHVVLGAGVAGLAVATELAARGIPVALVDRAGGPGTHGCSWWAGGMLAPWCEFENAEEPVLRHGQAAIGWWDRHAGGVARNGTLVVALTAWWAASAGIAAPWKLIYLVAALPAGTAAGGTASPAGAAILRRGGFFAMWVPEPDFGVHTDVHVAPATATR